MKFLQLAIGIFSLCIIATANAIQITDVKTFDKTFENGETFSFSYNLADFGFVAERDRIVGRASLIFEFRELPENREELEEHPFISLFIDQGRSFHDVYQDEDWVVDNGLAWFNEAGLMKPILLVSGNDVWLGDVTLNFEFTPGATTEVPEPLPIMLMGFGLLAIVMRRYKSHVTANR